MRMYSIHALWALVACVCAGGSLCAAAAQGQAIREGYPTKGVLQDEPTLSPPPLPEECDAFAIPDEFGEGCREGSEYEAPDAFVGVAQADGFPDGPSGPSNPVLRSAPFIECPAAVFVEELETGVIECRASDEAGARYRWTETGGPKNFLNLTNIRSPFFLAWKHTHHSLIPDGGIVHEYKASMLDSLGVEVASDEVTVTILDHPDLMTCTTEYEAYAGDPDIRLECDNKGNQGRWFWDVGPSHKREGVPDPARSYLSSFKSPKPLFRVPKVLAPGKEIEKFTYEACLFQGVIHPVIGKYEMIESEIYHGDGEEKAS